MEKKSEEVKVEPILKTQLTVDDLRNLKTCVVLVSKMPSMEVNQMKALLMLNDKLEVMEKELLKEPAI